MVPTLQHRGPSWATGPARELPPLPPAAPTEFEQLIAALGTPEQYWPEHPVIRKWVHQHKNFRYVPERLLEALGENVLEDWNL
jgi:hypothetical protein